MSAFGGKVDILDAPCNVRRWPKADIRFPNDGLQPVIPAKRRLETQLLAPPRAALS